MLNHLDRNNITLKDVNWKEIEDVVLEVVLGRLGERTRLRHATTRSADRNERELRALAEWVRQNSRRLERGERRMTYHQLEQLLKQHGFVFGRPNGNYIEILKVVNVPRKGLFWGRGTTTEKLQHVGTIGYPGEKREIAVVGIKQVRKICRLTDEHGVDSAAFYDQETALDEIVNRYRRVLRSLADK
jgi:death-on-curing protein